jgi:hypothetical protein
MRASANAEDSCGDRPAGAEDVSPRGSRRDLSWLPRSRGRQLRGTSSACASRHTRRADGACRVGTCHEHLDSPPGARRPTLRRSVRDARPRAVRGDDRRVLDRRQSRRLAAARRAPLSTNAAARRRTLERARKTGRRPGPAAVLRRHPRPSAPREALRVQGAEALDAKDAAGADRRRRRRGAPRPGRRSATSVRGRQQARQSPASRIGNGDQRPNHPDADGRENRE